MPNIRDLDMSQETIQAVVMGASGVGKTWLAGTFPRINILDFDGKVGVLRNPDFVKKYGIVDAKYENFSDDNRKKGFALTANALDEASNYFDAWMNPKGDKWLGSDGTTVKTHPDEFDTWVIDSGTSLTEVARNKALIVLGGKGRSTAFAQGKETGMATLERQDFGGERSLVEQFVRMVKQTDKNVLLLVHEAIQTNKDGSVVISIKPLFTGQSKEIISSMFKDVWGLKIRGVGTTLRRVLVTDYDGISAARSELGIGDIEHPDYEKIKAKIRERTNLTGLNQSGESQPAKVAAQV